jgi:tetratricopeptide (TPR) repeat protein
VKEGKNDEAEKYLSYDKEQSQTLAKTYPHTWSAALNVAKLRYEANDRDEALRILDGAMKLHPEIWDLVAFKAQILQDLSNLPEAISLVQSYSTTNWWHYGAHLTLGRLALKHGETERALAAFADASTLDIYSTEPLNFTARACLELKRPEKAYDAELKAIRRNPDQPSQYLMLSTILDELHRPDEAKAALERAQELADSAKARGA